MRFVIVRLSSSVVSSQAASSVLVGITEANEPILVLTRDQRTIPAASRWLTPYLTDTQLEEVVRATDDGRPWNPVPIVAIGHFDDPRAAECQEHARQLCLDRFVVDEIAQFDFDAVPAPTPTPTPSPFPYDSPPPAPFDPEGVCAPAGTEYSFVGWISANDLHDLMYPEIGFGVDTLYIAVTMEEVRLGGWYRVRGDDRKSLPIGRRICYATEYETGSLGFGYVKGSAYRVYRDGTTRDQPEIRR